MQSECEKAAEILKSEIENNADINWCISHIESCGNCQKQISLDKIIESKLRKNISKTAPISVLEPVMDQVYQIEKRHIPSRIKELITFAAMTILGIIPLYLIWYFRSDVIIYLNSIDLTAFWNKSLVFVRQLEINDFITIDIAGQFLSSPFIPLLLIISAVIVWTVSIIEFEKALK